MVQLKHISRRQHPYEVEIATMFSSDPHKSHLKNHCVPIFEVLADPNDDDSFMLVMPLLRAFDNPRFLTVGEAIEFFRQIFEVCGSKRKGTLCLLSMRSTGVAIYA